MQVIIFSYFFCCDIFPFCTFCFSFIILFLNRIHGKKSTIKILQLQPEPKLGKQTNMRVTLLYFILSTTRTQICAPEQQIILARLDINGGCKWSMKCQDKYGSIEWTPTQRNNNGHYRPRTIPRHDEQDDTLEMTV